MNYMSYLPVDVVNGEGTRCTLFVSGCAHKCDGCYNEASWKFNAGHEFTSEMEDRIIADLLDEDIIRDGISLSGGDPLHHRNLKAVEKLIDRVIDETGKNVWLWTGYTAEHITDDQRRVWTKCNVIIDGKFDRSLHDPSLKWRGSSNQRILIRQE